jgi:hypothetical protein
VFETESEQYRGRAAHQPRFKPANGEAALWRREGSTVEERRFSAA